METLSAANLVSQSQSREPSESQKNWINGHLNISACPQASAESSQARFQGVRFQTVEFVEHTPSLLIRANAMEVVPAVR